MQRKIVCRTWTLVLMALMGMLSVSVGMSAVAITEEQGLAIRDNCDTIKDSLRDLQRRDSRARVYLGRYYETMLSMFIMPLNVRLVENNLSSTGFINNQNDFYQMRASFTSDYVEYQKVLEELVGIDCKNEPERFYGKLAVVRERRAKVASDTEKLHRLAEKHIELVTELEVKL